MTTNPKGRPRIRPLIALLAAGSMLAVGAGVAQAGGGTAKPPKGAVSPWVIPTCHLIVQMPANTLSWADFVNGSATGAVPNTGLELRAVGNMVGTRHIAGQSPDPRFSVDQDNPTIHAATRCVFRAPTRALPVGMTRCARRPTGRWHLQYLTRFPLSRGAVTSASQGFSYLPAVSSALRSLARSTAAST